MNKLTLNLPGGYKVDSPPGLEATKFPDLASFINQLFIVIVYICVFLAFYYFVWGAFNYIMAQGKKEDIAKAKERIRWAVIGLIVVLLAYTLTTYIGDIFKPGIGGLPF